MNFGGSEDATVRRVRRGGKAAFLVPRGRPSGRRTAKFDIDEKALTRGSPFVGQHQFSHSQVIARDHSLSKEQFANRVLLLCFKY